MPQSETEGPKNVEQWLAIESELKDGEEKEGCKCLPSVARRMDCIAHRRHTKTGKMEDGSHTSVERVGYFGNGHRAGAPLPWLMAGP
jgi:hypothetical protein